MVALRGMFWKKKEKWAKEPEYEEFFDFQPDPEQLRQVNFPGVETKQHPVDVGLAFSLMMPFGESEKPPIDALPEPLRKDGPRDEASLHEQLSAMLAGQWGISQREELIDILEHLLDPPSVDDHFYRVFRPALQALIQLPQEERKQAVPQIKQQALSSVQVDSDFLELASKSLDGWLNIYTQPGNTKVLPQRLPRTVVSWDTARAARLARIGYLVGMLSAEEATTYSQRALQITRDNCTDWREHIDGFLLGRANWLEEVNNEALEHRDMLAFRLRHPESVWAKYPLHGRY